MSKEKHALNENIKSLLEQKMKNLVITHSSSLETDNLLSGEMEKYYFEDSAKMKISGNELIISEHKTNDGLCLELSKIEDISPIFQNNHLVFTQKYVCALLYDGKQVITFYFD